MTGKFSRCPRESCLFAEVPRQNQVGKRRHCRYRRGRHGDDDASATAQGGRVHATGRLQVTFACRSDKSVRICFKLPHRMTRGFRRYNWFHFLNLLLICFRASEKFMCFVCFQVCKWTGHAQLWGTQPCNPEEGWRGGGGDVLDAARTVGEKSCFPT